MIVRAADAIISPPPGPSVAPNEVPCHHRSLGMTAVAMLTLVLACAPVEAAADIALTPGPLGAWDAGMIHAPSVIQTGEGYLMYYDGTAGTDPYEGWSIGVAMSSDGERWEKYAGNPILTGGSYHDPQVLRVGNEYRMWYSSLRQERWHIEGARSWDALRWEREGPALGPGPPGSWDETGVAYSSVLDDHMWYQGRDIAGRWRIGHAVSDGLRWRKDPANPVLDIGPPGAWDGERVFTPAVERDGNRWRMVYAGSPGWGLGYAYSKDGGRWRKALGNPMIAGRPSRASGNGPRGPQLMTPAVLGQKIWYAVIGSGGQTAIESRQAPR